MIQEVANRLNTLRKYVDILRGYQSKSLEDIEKDFTLKGAIERYLQVAIECALDIGEIIIAAEGFRKPETYREVIEILGKEGVLPQDFAIRFAPAAGFRNILVHAYSDIDVRKLYEFLQERLEDFDTFAMYISRYLEKKISQE